MLFVSVATAINCFWRDYPKIYNFELAFYEKNQKNYKYIICMGKTIFFQNILLKQNLVTEIFDRNRAAIFTMK